MNIALGSDHAGFELASLIAAWLGDDGVEVERYGAVSTEPFDYPDAAADVCSAVQQGRADLGILCCGAGIGMSIAANRYPGIRAALCCNPTMAELSRQHNHANVLCLGGRLTPPDRARNILDTFLKTEPSREERHVRRIEKLDSGV